MPRFRTNDPSEIEAVRWTGHNWPTVARFVGDDEDKVEVIHADGPSAILVIRTPEGERRARPGDWVLRDRNGNLDACKDATFQATYEPVEEDA